MDASNVILEGVVGSTAYGLAGPDSDIDKLGVYRAPIKEVLGLNHDKVVDGTKVEKAPQPDRTLHEVGKYMRLAMQCNPTVLELMYLNEYVTQTWLGRWLVSNRHHFLSGPAVKGRYGGYATAQAERLMDRHKRGEVGFGSDVGNRTEKHGRHCARLLLQGAQLLREGTITVNVSQHRDRLFEVGRMALSAPEEFYRTFLDMRAALDSTETNLPDKPNRDKLEDLLVAIRMWELA